MRSFLVLLSLVALAVGPAPAAGAELRADFDGDGYGDLAVGVPKEDVLGVKDAGGVNILYGSAAGLSASGNRFFTLLDSPDRALQEGAELGAALAVGDFDRDGFADLAVAAPMWDLREVNRTAKRDAGAVVVLYGSSVGLTRLRNQLFFEVRRVSDAPVGERFGSALAAGDFDGDGFDDLAVGIPGWSPSVRFTIPRAGGVTVLYGSRRGLTSKRRELWTQDTSGVREHAEENDRFGEALAAGDFDGDDDDDLAIGVPSEDSNAGPADVGAVHVLYGTDDGLTADGDQVWSQFNVGAGVSAEYGDWFGSVLAAGDFDASGADDLAVGVPHEDDDRFWPGQGAGAVQVLYGSAAGLRATRSQLWQPSWIEGGPVPTGHAYGAALAMGDFDENGADDLALGIPNDGAGSVSVLYGSPGGLRSSVDPWWPHVMSSGFTGEAHSRERYGQSLAAGDFDGDSDADLAVGAPLASVPLIRGVIVAASAGRVKILYSRPGIGPGFVDDSGSPNSQDWGQGEQSVGDLLDEPERDDRFGSALAA